MMGPIGGSPDFDCSCTRTVATPGVASDVGLKEDDTDEEGDDREDRGVVNVVVPVIVLVEEGVDPEEELNEVVSDDEGRVASLTIKKSSKRSWEVLPAYSMVNTWEVTGRTGDWKSSWRYCVLPISLAVTLTGVP
jgi:hypothetical protein